VAGVVRQTQGAVGYLSFDFAVSAGLNAAQIKARDGTYIAPSIQSISAGAGALSFPIQADTNILDSTAPGAYPIASTSYVLIYTDQKNKDKAQTLVDFWTWALTKGQAEATAINYAPLPTGFAQQALQQLSKITANGQPVKASTPVAG
jgi:phosphate transport system substrate-binding protein